MANNPIDNPASDGSLLRQHSPILDWVGRVDDGIDAVERAVVSTALVIMTTVVFLDIYYRFLTSQRAAWAHAGEDGTLSIGNLLPGIALGLVAVAMFRAAYIRSAPLRGEAGLSTALAVFSTAILGAASWAMLAFSSTAVGIVLLGLAGLGLVLAILDTPRPIGTPALSGSTLLRLGVTIVGIVAMISFATNIPAGYSWTQKFALFLLLWLSFIGASMATRDGRHLQIDAVRKAVPARILPWYNGASYLVSAAFTAVFLYLSVLYMQSRMAEVPAPGEIPDWIKVLSIPVSLGLVTVRFIGRAIASMLVAALGLQHPAPAATEEVTN